MTTAAGLTAAGNEWTTAQASQRIARHQQQLFFKDSGRLVHRVQHQRISRQSDTSSSVSSWVWAACTTIKPYEQQVRKLANDSLPAFMARQKCPRSFKYFQGCVFMCQLVTEETERAIGVRLLDYWRRVVFNSTVGGNCGYHYDRITFDLIHVFGNRIERASNEKYREMIKIIVIEQKVMTASSSIIHKIKETVVSEGYTAVSVDAQWTSCQAYYDQLSKVSILNQDPLLVPDDPRKDVLFSLFW